MWTLQHLVEAQSLGYQGRAAQTRSCAGLFHPTYLATTVGKRKQPEEQHYQPHGKLLFTWEHSQTQEVHHARHFKVSLHPNWVQLSSTHSFCLPCQRGTSRVPANNDQRPASGRNLPGTHTNSSKCPDSNPGIGAGPHPAHDEELAKATCKIGQFE